MSKFEVIRRNVSGSTGWIKRISLLPWDETNSGTEAHTKDSNILSGRNQSQSHITTDSQSASQTWCQAPIWDRDQFFFLLDIFFKQFRVCNFVPPSPTRGRVCNLFFLLVLASAVTFGLPSLTRGQVCLLAAFCQYQSIVSQYVYKIFTLSVFDTVQRCIYNIYKASFSPRPVQQIMP
jgi:hypothetical protein